LRCLCLFLLAHVREPSLNDREQDRFIGSANDRRATDADCVQLVRDALSFLAAGHHEVCDELAAYRPRYLEDRVTNLDANAVDQTFHAPTLSRSYSSWRLFGYSERRAILEDLKLNGPHWRTPEAFDAGEALWEAVCEPELEGVVAKKRSGRYVPGERGWIKTKNRDENRDY
jgi:hypothetical protein